MHFLKTHGHWALTLFVAFVFIQSLFFKFTGSPETVYIFEGKLDPWAASLGFAGVFAPSGIFSAKVVDGSSDGGELFMLACGVWVSCLLLLWIRRDVWLPLVNKVLGRA